jgi:hypothetical protein
VAKAKNNQQMTKMTTKEEVTKEVVNAFDDYYYERFWYDLNGEPMSKKKKAETATVDELVEKKLDGDETLAIALGAVDYYILKCNDDVLGDDNGRTLFVKEIHERAKIWKAKHGGLFDAVAIGAALKVKGNEESERGQKCY